MRARRRPPKRHGTLPWGPRPRPSPNPPGTGRAIAPGVARAATTSQGATAVDAPRHPGTRAAPPIPLAAGSRGTDRRDPPRAAPRPAMSRAASATEFGRMAFLTVGSTYFEELVRAADTDAFARALRARGFARLVMQVGYGPYRVRRLVSSGEGRAVHASGLSVEVVGYEATVHGRLSEAELVITHAGAGSIFEALAMGRTVVAVPNPRLAGNHQEQLARELARGGHLFACAPGELVATIAGYDPSLLVPYESVGPGAAASKVEGAAWRPSRISAQVGARPGRVGGSRGRPGPPRRGRPRAPPPPPRPRGAAPAGGPRPPQRAGCLTAADHSGALPSPFPRRAGARGDHGQAGRGPGDLRHNMRRRLRRVGVGLAGPLQGCVCSQWTVTHATHDAGLAPQAPRPSARASNQLASFHFFRRVRRERRRAMRHRGRENWQKDLRFRRPGSAPAGLKRDILQRSESFITINIPPQTTRIAARMANRASGCGPTTHAVGVPMPRPGSSDRETCLTFMTHTA